MRRTFRCIDRHNTHTSLVHPAILVSLSGCIIPVSLHLPVPHLSCDPHTQSLTMVLDLDLFRVDKGGDPDRVRQTVVNRFKDVATVDQVIALDVKWRKFRHELDRLNKAKNSISKSYGAKMKAGKGKEEAAGDADKSPVSPLTDLSDLLEQVENIGSEVTLSQLKHLRVCTEEQTIRLTQEMADCENERNEVLREIGNLLHPDVPISDDEDNNAVIRTNGNIELGVGLTGDQAYKSHVDLIAMIGGVNLERGSAIAGTSVSF